MSTYQPKTFKPEHIHIVRLHWQGYDNSEIAQFLACSESHVSLILKCDEAQRLLSQLREHTIDNYLETQDDFQLVLPLVRREKIRLALESKDERIRSINCADILAIAGHSPVRRLEITRGVPSEDMSKLSPEQLREIILQEMGLQQQRQPVIDVTDPNDSSNSGPGPDDLIQ